jgi:hypothetical protein
LDKLDMETQELNQNQEQTKVSLREQLRQEIDQVSDEILASTLDFILFLKSREAELSNAKKTNKNPDLPYRPASGKSLVNYQGGWVGDDFEECLQQVHDSRSKVNFLKHEPF